MSQKRMFSKQIIDSDAFLDMPPTAQLLYFHLVMRADDEGFVGNPRKIMREVGIQGDDFKLLVGKRFLIVFESGVVVIKHWLIHNTIRMDRFHPTSYLDEKNLLITKENKAYSETGPITVSASNIDDIVRGVKRVFRKAKMATNGLPNGNQMATQLNLTQLNLSKDNLTKDNAEPSSAEDISEIIDAFKEVNISYKKWFANTSQRKAISRLLKVQPKERILQVISVLSKSNKLSYVPTITTPLQLEDKWSALESALSKKKSELLEKSKKTEIYGL